MFTYGMLLIFLILSYQSFVSTLYTIPRQVQRQPTNRRGSRCISSKVDDNLVVGGEVVLLSQIRRHFHSERERERRAASRRQPTARRGKPGYLGVLYVVIVHKEKCMNTYFM